MLRNINGIQWPAYLAVIILICWSIETSEASKNVSRGLRIDKLTNCKAKLDDGKIIDLSQLDNAKSPLSADDGDYTFFYNPCSPIDCVDGTGTIAANCQKNKKDQSLKYDCGDQDSVAFAYDGTALTLTYESSKSPDGVPRTTKVSCVCNDNENFQYIDERPRGVYLFRLTSKCCCPDKCKGGKGGSEGGLSLGSILLIIFFSLLFSYFVGGIAFMIFVKKKSVREAIPNQEFWVGLPGNVKAGVSFTISKVKGSNNQYSQI